MTGLNFIDEDCVKIQTPRRFSKHRYRVVDLAKHAVPLLQSSKVVAHSSSWRISLELGDVGLREPLWEARPTLSNDTYDVEHG